MELPETELRFSFSRASGAGGQNINKLNTKVTLRWSIDTSAEISPATKARFKEKFAGFINDAGEVVIHRQAHRSQRDNAEECRAKLLSMLKEASIVPKKRRKTKPTKGSVERRLSGKKKDAATKRLRRERFD